jgi:pimeloyl-ACP methyl ester carboxylesterase
LGGPPETQADRYRASSPLSGLPLGMPQVLLTGERDGIVPPQLARDYAERATKAGDQVTVRIVPNTGHFEVVAPDTPAGREVVRIVKDLATH